MSNQLVNSSKSSKLPKIAINGLSGKMGQQIKNLAPNFASQLDITDLEDKNTADLIIDFSNPSALDELIANAIKLNQALVIGTTGFNDIELEKIKQASCHIPILYSPNMSIGVNLCFDMLETLAKTIGIQSDIKIFETHHKHKIDAPSGTALKMGQIIAENNIDPQAISYSSLREGEVIGEHTVCFEFGGEIIEIKHTALDRSIFAQGALKAALWLQNKPAGLYKFSDCY